MTIPDASSTPITLAVREVVLLAELLADLDGFLRSPAHHADIWAALRDYCTGSGLLDAGYLIDAVGLFAGQLEKLIEGLDRADGATGQHLGS